MAVFLISLVASLALSGYFQKKGPSVEKSEIKEEHPFPTILQYNWVDQNNESYRIIDHSTKYKLIYFGFLNSPIDPIALKVMEDAYKTKFAKELELLYVSLDPSRDQKSQIKRFLDFEKSSVRAILGDHEITKELAQAFGVRFEKFDTPQSKMLYTIDVSPWIYLTTPDFRILGAYPYQIRMERLKMEISSHMKAKH
ncbi:SCO family protein [Leptospira sp. GIMC2001]|uniref:SCO family protein n=1 Tax=Leptospira sp. GIMC2001 TaxID=1513297 RepID=UPI002349761A|nr:SCO family protein [Leptospira sp. GIMC2001]WCL48431.1 SCO family protein [Leptospira sp. GIMC2001]